MSKDYSSMSLLEIAIDIQSGSERTKFNDLYKKVCEAKGFDEEEAKKHIAQLYTDITASGDFVYCGDDLWNLKKNEKLDILDKEYEGEHGDVEGYEEEEKPKTKRKPAKKLKKSVEEIEEEENREEIESEDEGYENQEYDSYDSTEDDEEYDTYEKDFDSELDEDKDSFDDEEDDFDEDKYNDIMDEYEDAYDK